jgi:TorA maturation chaperone TorD
LRRETPLAHKRLLTTDRNFRSVVPGAAHHGGASSSSELLAQVKNISRSRQSFYSFLTTVFQKELTEDIIRELQSKSDSLLALRAMEDLDNEKLNSGRRILGGYLAESAKRNLAAVHVELAMEYAGLFLGVWGAPSHPSESVYAGGTKMSKERDEVLKSYTQAGLIASEKFREPEDHIAMELQFMSFLSGETAKAAEAGDTGKAIETIETQESFLKKHLGHWIGLLTRDVLKTGRVGFYKGICLITTGFVEEDIKILSDLKEELASAV